MYFKTEAILFVSSIAGILILGGHTLMTEETNDIRLQGPDDMNQCVNQLITQDGYELPNRSLLLDNLIDP